MNGDPSSSRDRCREHYIINPPTTSTSSSSSSPTTTTTTSTSSSTTQLSLHEIDQLTSQLFHACINNDIPQMKLLIQQKADPNGYANIYDEYKDDPNNYAERYPGDPNNNLLHAAALSNNTQTIDFVIELLGGYHHNNDGIHINIIEEPDLQGYTALYIAARKGCLISVQHLIEKYNANPCYTFEFDGLFIDIAQLALRSKNIQLMHYLLDLNKSHYFININGDYWHGFIGEKTIGFSFLKSVVEQYGVDIDSEILCDAVSVNNIELVEHIIHHCDLNSKLAQDQWIFESAAHKAACGGAIDVFKHLIHKYNINPLNDEINNPLLHPLMSNKNISLEFIDYCINDLGCNVNAVNRNGESSLIKSIKNGRNEDLRIAKHLIIQHNATFIPSQKYSSSHILTCILSSPDCDISFVDILIERDLFLPNMNDGVEVVLKVVKSRPLPFIQYLLQHKATIPQNHYVLRTAAINDDPNVLDYFLQHSHFQSFINPTLLTKLYFKTDGGKNELVAKLLIEKYNVNPTTQYAPRFAQSMNLMQYILRNNKEMFYSKPNFTLFNYLVQLGCFDLEQLHKSERWFGKLTTLLRAVEHFQTDDPSPRIKCLVENGADIHAVSSNYKMNILHMLATSCEYITLSPTLDYLMNECGLNINSTSSDGKNMLHHLFGGDISLRSKISVTYKVILCGIDINHQDNFLQTPLHILSESQFFNPYNTQTLKIFLKQKPNTELRNNRGNTPLLNSALFNNFSISKMLIQHNANILSLTNNGMSILHILCGHEKNTNNHHYFLSYKAFQLLEFVILAFLK